MPARPCEPPSAPCLQHDPSRSERTGEDRPRRRRDLFVRRTIGGGRSILERDKQSCAVRLDNVICLAPQIEDDPDFVAMVPDADLLEEPMADVHRRSAKG